MDKQKYFSSNTIVDMSRKMKERIETLGISNSRLKFDPLKSALLVLDAQKYFFLPDSHAFIPSAPGIIPNIQNLVNYFCKIDRPIFFSKHGNISNNAGMMAVWWKDLLVSGSDMADLIQDFDTKKGLIIEKERYDAFWKTRLHELLKVYDTEQIVICGVMTHLCCETTARSAFVRDYQVFFTIDGTATYTEDLHMASLLTLSHGFAKTVLCDEVR